MINKMLTCKSVYIYIVSYNTFLYMSISGFESMCPKNCIW